MKKHLLRMLSFGLLGCFALGVQLLSADPIGVQISMNKNNSFLILLCFDHLNSLSRKYGLYFNL